MNAAEKKELFGPSFHSVRAWEPADKYTKFPIPGKVLPEPAVERDRLVFLSIGRNLWIYQSTEKLF